MGFPASIDQLWVFGSHARGDQDNHSDVDILMVSSLDETDYVRNYCYNKYVGKIDIAHYSYEGLLHLINAGTLFAWHLKNEAIPIYQRTTKLQDILDGMPRYSGHIGDLSLLEMLLHDVKLSLSKSSNSFIFDAGMLGTIVRNTSIIMSNYLGDDDYSPRAPFKLTSLERTLAMPLSDLEYRFLQRCRRSGERGDEVEAIEISLEKLLVLIDDIAGWHRECVNYIDQKELVK